MARLDDLKIRETGRGEWRTLWVEGPSGYRFGVYAAHKDLVEEAAKWAESTLTAARLVLEHEARLASEPAPADDPDEDPDTPGDEPVIRDPEG